MPSRRNGNRNNQTSGNSTSATSAKGQHITSRMHHRRNLTMLSVLSAQAEAMQACPRSQIFTGRYARTYGMVPFQPFLALSCRGASLAFAASSALRSLISFARSFCGSASTALVLLGSLS